MRIESGKKTEHATLPWLHSIALFSAIPRMREPTQILNIGNTLYSFLIKIWVFNSHGVDAHLTNMQAKAFGKQSYKVLQIYVSCLQEL